MSASAMRLLRPLVEQGNADAQNKQAVATYLNGGNWRGRMHVTASHRSGLGGSRHSCSAWRQVDRCAGLAVAGGGRHSFFRRKRGRRAMKHPMTPRCL